MCISLVPHLATVDYVTGVSIGCSQQDRWPRGGDLTVQWPYVSIE